MKMIIGLIKSLPKLTNCYIDGSYKNQLIHPIAFLTKRGETLIFKIQIISIKRIENSTYLCMVARENCSGFCSI